MCSVKNLQRMPGSSLMLLASTALSALLEGL